MGQVGGKGLGGGAEDDENGRCGRPASELVDLDEFGSAGSWKKQGEGPGGRGMGQGRRGGQGEEIGVEGDALVDGDDVDGRQEKKRRGSCGLRPLLRAKATCARRETLAVGSYGWVVRGKRANGDF